nr:immunoglobulin heavy chain junction region [Macaca mulatta]
CARQDSNLDSW